MDTLNGIRSHSPYSQRSWIVHFLQDLLTCGIVILTPFLLVLARRKFSFTCCSLKVVPFCVQSFASQQLAEHEQEWT
jgi:hypothetical protein